MEARYSAPVQTGSGVNPASYTMGTGSFSGVKRPGRGVDHPDIAPRLKKEYSYNRTPPVCLHDSNKVKFTFHSRRLIIFCIRCVHWCY